MLTTNQTKSVTVAQHGKAVFEKTKCIISGQWDGMKIPEWLKTHHTQITANLLPIKVIEAYNLLHDCGKPFCLKHDAEGNTHFPNHEKISKEVYLKFHPKPNPIVANLIGWDMCLHKETAEQIKSYNWDVDIAMTLLITSLAEIHANSEMFGGIDSVSFKMKWKKINKRGKMFMNHYFPKKESEHPYVYVIVRNDLENAQKAVQGTHAAIEYARNSMSTEEEHPSVIYIVVRNEKKLKSVAKKLLGLGINIQVFREPDADYEMTSIVTEPLVGYQRSYLQKFQLMK